MDFGNKLKELRKAMGLTQEQLASRLGISKSVVSFYELKERTPSPEILVKICKIFNVSSDYLLGLDNKRNIDVSELDDESIMLLQSLINKLK